MYSDTNYLLGIDLGTTNVKAMLIDEDGNTIAGASRPNTTIFPGPDMVEQDANLWWDNTVSILKEITEAAGSGIVSRIQGISVSSQTVTLLPVDQDGFPLRNALHWMDRRSMRELDFLLEKIGTENYTSIIGALPNVAFLPNKILWFRTHEPEVFEKTHKILQASSYINFKLTGEMTMDLDQAIKSQCLNLRSLQWSTTIEEAVGVDFGVLLPTPQKETQIIGYVTKEAAAATGLAAGIPVIAGTSDANASVYATGISRPGEACESSGTTSLLFLASEVPNTKNHLFMSSPGAVDDIPYLFGAPINTSGAAVKWYLDTLGVPEKNYAEKNRINVYDHLNQLALDVPAGSNGLLFFPYLLGERAPLWNSHARGMFIGLSLDTSRREILRSVFEGTAFAIRHVMEIYQDAGGRLDSLRITGGGAKSRTWSMIKASMLKIPVSILDESSCEIPSGDCLLAGLSVGVFKNLCSAAKKTVRVKEVIHPVKAWSDMYDKLYPYYIEMYRHLDKDLMQLEKELNT